MPEPAGRELAALRDWACAALGIDPDAASLEPLAGDASFRRYTRLRSAGGSWMLCDAPPARERHDAFVAVARILDAIGVRVPAVRAAQLERGWLCLEDLGDRLLLPRLSADSVDGHYGAAMLMLRRLARADTASLDLPPYDGERLRAELALFPRWFCARLLGRPLDVRGERAFEALCDALCARALAQPQVLVHRDFHARNLMLLPGDELATIDFQDALIGPLSYDLVSLLRDCYRRWPAPRVRGWALAQRAALAAEGVAVPAAADFLVDFDWMGLQRHLKVLGIFARLWLRDGKDGYLADLPRVMAYLREVLAAYPGEPVLADFAALFEAQLLPAARGAPWYRAA